MVSQKKDRTGEERLNNQGCLMKIVEYNNAQDIIVEFQDEYKGRVHTQYANYKRGNVKNPYCPLVCRVGAIGDKYPAKVNYKNTKEYIAWQGMICRCFDEEYKQKEPTYKNVTCCNEWLIFGNFYEWLHSQENFDKWYINDDWHLDKDILIKGNKIYSPETCCLVPRNVNNLFIKQEMHRGEYPIGISKRSDGNGFAVRCMNPITHKRDYLGRYETPEKAFYLKYKPYKENLIKQIAEIEYNKGNITEKCYQAMLNYRVEITD